MSLSNPNSILVLLGIGAIVLEIILGAATGFDLFIIGIIFIISGGTGILLSSFEGALITTVILCFLYVFIGRKFIKEKLYVETKKSNADALLGKKGLVTKKIFPHKPGQVKVGGEIWRAESEKEIDESREVVVQSVSGVTLKVL